MEGFCLTLVALKSDAVRSYVLLQLLSRRKSKGAPTWMSALVFLTRCAVGIEFNRRRVAFVALVADLGLGCGPELPFRNRVLSI